MKQKDEHGQDHVRLRVQMDLNGTIRDTTDDARRDSTNVGSGAVDRRSNRIAPQAWRYPINDNGNERVKRESLHEG
jgi:hypothetical protein